MSEHVHHLALSLRDLGQTVELLTTQFSQEQDDSSLPLPVTRFGRALLVPLNRSHATVPFGLRLSGQVQRFLRERKFDVVHSHGLLWPEISYWAIRHSRALNVVSFLTAGFKIMTFGSGLYRRLFRGHLGQIHGRIAISQRARQAGEPYVPGEYRIIPCGIDLDRFRRGLEPLPSSQPRPPTILFLGRLDGRKGILALLRALPLVLAKVPGARLVVAGTGPEEQRARSLVRELGIDGSVLFAGRVERSDLPRYYAGCDVYCSPALGGETLGIVLLEAMATGTPVVASDIPGYDETIRNGRDGILVEPDRPEALAGALVRLLSDARLRESLSRAGVDRARQYAWPSVAARTLDFYRELLEQRGPR